MQVEVLWHNSITAAIGTYGDRPSEWSIGRGRRGREGQREKTVDGCQMSNSEDAARKRVHGRESAAVAQACHVR
jgi:hypothetical protein